MNLLDLIDVSSTLEDFMLMFVLVDVNVNVTHSLYLIHMAHWNELVSVVPQSLCGIKS